MRKQEPWLQAYLAPCLPTPYGPAHSRPDPMPANVTAAADAATAREAAAACAAAAAAVSPPAADAQQLSTVEAAFPGSFCADLWQSTRDVYGCVLRRLVEPLCGGLAAAAGSSASRLWHVWRRQLGGGGRQHALGRDAGPQLVAPAGCLDSSPPAPQAAARLLTDPRHPARQPLASSILAHPFLRGLVDGSLPEAAFRFYIVQDVMYLRWGSGMGEWWERRTTWRCHLDALPTAPLAVLPAGQQGRRRGPAG